VRRTLWLFAALLLTVSAAEAQGPSLDPSLRALLRPERRAAAEAALREGQPSPDQPGAAGLLALDLEGPRGEVRVGAFVRLRAPGALAELRASGAEIGTVAGDVATARIPLSSLLRLQEAVGIERIEGAYVVERRNDLAMSQVRADRVRNRVGGAWQGFAGQGVVVAVYDTGIDYQHEDFRDPAGQTRLLGLWDQTLGGTPPAGFGYGTFCDVASLSAGTCGQRDIDGHGTHVAGSAAGNGGGIGGLGTNEFAGVAPAASLLIVKGGDGTFAEDRIIEGIDWVFREAGRLGRAAVINLSLGSQYGPHDGTRLYEQLIDNLSGPGRIVVTSAGNDGANPSGGGVRRLIHATALPTAGATQTFTITVPTYTPVTAVRGNRLRINFWYRGADRLQITVVRPDGSQLAAAYGQNRQEAHPNGGIEIDNASGGPNPQNGDNEAFILIENLPGAGNPMSGTWTIQVTAQVAASGRPYHFWFYSNTIAASGVQGFTNSHLVGSPGTARRAITVGAYVSRVTWLSVDGNTYSFGARETQEQPGDIAQFSSVGPTRDGRLKPEITGPGKVILSSLSRHASPPRALVVGGERHYALQGTSMSSPVVAGGVALVLQRAPGLTPEDIRQILANTAIRDAFTDRTYVTGDPGGIPNFTWGWGKLNVEGSVAAAGELARFSVLGVAVTPIPVPATLTGRRGTRVPLLRIALSAEGPEALDVTQLGFGLIGDDPGAQLLIFRDLDNDGQIGAQDPLLATRPAPLQPNDTTRITVPLALRIPAGQTVSLLAAVELSGAAPHRGLIRAWFRPADTRTVEAATGEARTVRQPTAVVPAQDVRPTVLDAGEAFALSENPVRSSQLVFNFRSQPSMAAVYTVSGRQVIDLLPLLQDNVRITWNLTNTQGAAVAPGVYLLVVQVGGETIRERLIIARPAGGGE
jgi:subtilisin family serine protease